MRLFLRARGEKGSASAVSHRAFRVCILLFTGAYLLLFLFSGSLFPSLAAESFTVFFGTVFPAVAPFACAFALFSRVFPVVRASCFLHPFAKRVCNVSGLSFFTALTGLITGYPSGALAAASLYKKGKLTAFEAEFVAYFSSAASPLLMITCIGGCTYQSTKTGALFYLSHLAATFLAVRLFCRPPRFKKPFPVKPASLTPSTALFTGSADSLFFPAMKGLLVSAALTSLFYPLPFLAFRVFPFLTRFPLLSATFTGLWETTAGANAFSLLTGSLPKAMLTATLSFGGVPLYVQTLPALSAFGAKKARFFLFKTAQSLFTFLFSFAALTAFSL